MYRILAFFVLSGFAGAQSSLVADLNPTNGTTKSPTANTNAAPNALPNLPGVPKGKSTVIGGTISKVDPVRDQLTVNVYGGHNMKIFFDGRTQVFENGQRVSLRDLKDGNRASVETLLDGTMVFARSIHILTQSVEGESQGQVIAYNASTGELDLRDTLMSRPLKLRVPPGTRLASEGQQTAAARLSPGTLVRVKFEPDGSGRGVVTGITVVATPGSQFVFTGKVAFLDNHAGLLVVVDPRDDKRYEISFDPRLSVTRDLHQGDDVTVTAKFDGTHYAASDVKVNPIAPPTTAPN